jgi:hypothetical protein
MRRDGERYSHKAIKFNTIPSIEIPLVGGVTSYLIELKLAPPAECYGIATSSSSTMSTARTLGRWTFSHLHPSTRAAPAERFPKWYNDGL